MHVTLIGAGIVGLCTALEFAKRGHTVTVLDPEEPGSGASFGNAGIVSTGACVPLAIPGLLRRLPPLLVDGRKLSIDIQAYSPVRFRN